MAVASQAESQANGCRKCENFDDADAHDWLKGTNNQTAPDKDNQLDQQPISKIE